VFSVGITATRNRLSRSKIEMVRSPARNTMRSSNSRQFCNYCCGQRERKAIERKTKPYHLILIVILSKMSGDIDSRMQSPLAQIEKNGFLLDPGIRKLDKGSGPWRGQKDRAAIYACMGHMSHRLEYHLHAQFQEMREGHRRSTLAETWVRPGDESRSA
jgi:hypothetical protein